MDIKTNITINELTPEGVIIHTQETIEYAGQTIPLSENKTHYPNSPTGRGVFAEAMQGQEKIYNTVMMLWGDEPVVSERAEPADEAEPTDDTVVEGDGE